MTDPYLALLVGGPEHGKMWALPEDRQHVVTLAARDFLLTATWDEALVPEVDKIIYEQVRIAAFGYTFPIYPREGLTERERNRYAADLLLSDDAKRLIGAWR